ncbi:MULTISPECIES: hypothetical protein [unclassified Clostridioides]|uniref:hypothetical protein n=1 Tax=unclassified Clostridioides TaxID=2635829 RepID=UPI001D12B83E|nr:hypothetical protein [Clostridioides sp. ES-S-0049-03]MCC0678216.1 hypothetical protein [Clostridioides sp. ES-W-0018-02]MCC0713042.1 hypothetical protein [Clostridioides sp. ES-W-0017-02]
MLENSIREYFTDCLSVRIINDDITALESRIDNIYNCLNNILHEDQQELLVQFDELQIELKQLEMFQSYKIGLIEGIKFT